MHADRRRVPRIGGWAGFNLNEKWRKNVLIVAKWVQFVIGIYKCTAFAARHHIGHRASFLPQIARFCQIWSDMGAIWCQDACSTNRFRCAAFVAVRHICHKAPFPTNTIKGYVVARIGAGLEALLKSDFCLSTYWTVT